MALSKTKPAPPKKTTLDTDYNMDAKQFNAEHKQLPAKKKKLKQLQTQHDQACYKQMSEMTNEEITDFYKIKKEIGDLEKEIQNTENYTNMTSFYLKTGQILLDYYDNLNQDTSEKRKGRPPKVKKTSESKPMVDMKTFYSTANKDKDAEKSQSTEANQPNKGPSRTLQSLVKPKTTLQRADIHELYKACTNPHHISTTEYSKQEDFCFECGEYRELFPSEALFVCPNCGDEVPTVLESDKPSYKDPPHENMYFAYKRINHFKEQLSHMQAKDTTSVPQEVFDVILVEFKKEKRTNLALLTKARVKIYLQRYAHLGYNKYYENVNKIICYLNGMQPLSMPPEVEEQLCAMFQKIQEPFEKHCPPDRINFLSYSYVIHKFCQLLGYHEYLPYFNLLKSKDKLHQQDKIWKKICIDLGWKYHASSH